MTSAGPEAESNTGAKMGEKMKGGREMVNCTHVSVFILALLSPDKADQTCV